MGKKSRLKRERRELRAQNILPVWDDEAGIHTVVPVLPGVSTSEMQKKMTIEYQKTIKESPVWSKIVEEFGKEKAEALLKQCEAKIE